MVKFIIINFKRYRNSTTLHQTAHSSCSYEDAACLGFENVEFV